MLNKADAVRMWLNKTIETIITRLNGPFNRANYTKETFHQLFEIYYIENNNTASNKNKRDILLKSLVIWAILFI